MNTPLHYAGMKVIIDQNMVDNITETIVYEGHPFIRFLAEYILFSPDTIHHITRTTPKMNGVIYNNTLIIHPIAYEKLLKITKS